MRPIGQLQTNPAAAQMALVKVSWCRARVQISSRCTHGSHDALPLDMRDEVRPWSGRR